MHSEPTLWFDFKTNPWIQRAVSSFFSLKELVLHHFWKCILKGEWNSTKILDIFHQTFLNIKTINKKLLNPFLSDSCQTQSVSHSSSFILHLKAQVCSELTVSVVGQRAEKRASTSFICQCSCWMWLCFRLTCKWRLTETLAKTFRP